MTPKTANRLTRDLIWADDLAAVFRPHRNLDQLAADTPNFDKPPSVSQAPAGFLYRPITGQSAAASE
jgi:hypothetical protein